MDSVIQKETECYMCHTTINLQCHHVMNGNPYRKYSEQDGLKIYLCVNCHKMVHASIRIRLSLKVIAEQMWCAYYNKTTADFIKRYGKSYIE